MRYLVLHLIDAQNGGMGDRNWNVICLDPPCLMSTSRISETSRGLLGLCTMGCMSQEVGQHFQAYVAGPVSSTRQRHTFFKGGHCGSTAPQHHWRHQHGCCCPPERGPSSEAIWKKEPAEETPSAMGTSIPASKTPMLQSVINVPSGAALAQADGGAMTASLDLGEEDGEEPFHEFNQHRMQQCGVGEPSEPPQRVQPHLQRGLSPKWQTIRWLQQCEVQIKDDEVVWWTLIDPLTDGSDATSQALARRLVAMWRWTFTLSEYHICPPALTSLNIEQFLL